jgi:hypothetical protein
LKRARDVFTNRKYWINHSIDILLYCRILILMFIQIIMHSICLYAIHIIMHSICLYSIQIIMQCFIIAVLSPILFTFILRWWHYIFHCIQLYHT